MVSLTSMQGLLYTLRDAGADAENTFRDDDLNLQRCTGSTNYLTKTTTTRLARLLLRRLFKDHPGLRSKICQRFTLTMDEKHFSEDEYFMLDTVLEH